MYDKQKQAALKVANRVRKMLGLEPATKLLKGDMEEPASCPISRTILYGTKGKVRRGISPNTDTDKIEISVGGKRKSVKVPQTASDFISLFDDGYMPELLSR